MILRRRRTPLSWASNLKQFTNYQFETHRVPPLAPPKLHPALALLFSKHAVLYSAIYLLPSFCFIFVFHSPQSSSVSFSRVSAAPLEQVTHENRILRILNPINVSYWAVVAVSTRASCQLDLTVRWVHTCPESAMSWAGPETIALCFWQFYCSQATCQSVVSS